jgi:hypothetical protein
MISQRVHSGAWGILAQDVGMGFSFSPGRKWLLVAPAKLREGERFLLSRKTEYTVSNFS